MGRIFSSSISEAVYGILEGSKKDGSVESSLGRGNGRLRTDKSWYQLLQTPLMTRTISSTHPSGRRSQTIGKRLQAARERDDGRCSSGGPCGIGWRAMMYRGRSTRAKTIEVELLRLFRALRRYLTICTRHVTTLAN